MELVQAVMQWRLSISDVNPSDSSTAAVDDAVGIAVAVLV
jgi:hypothetical protein